MEAGKDGGVCEGGGGGGRERSGGLFVMCGYEINYGVVYVCVCVI
jgi:hypothetical protein